RLIQHPPTPPYRPADGSTPGCPKPAFNHPTTHNTPQTAPPRYSHPHATPPTTPHLTRGKGQAKPLLNRRSERVLPAEAGVCRRAGSVDAPDPRPPRRRGGGPTIGIDGDGAPASSPPPRGCSDPAVGRSSGSSVLPAGAGVFRDSEKPMDTALGPPRRRGGVPLAGLTPRELPKSSPQTRGCSVGSLLRETDFKLLHAVGGVVRLYQLSRRAHQ